MGDTERAGVEPEDVANHHVPRPLEDVGPVGWRRRNLEAGSFVSVGQVAQVEGLDAEKAGRTMTNQMTAGGVSSLAKTTVLDHGYVGLVGTWGSDEQIVEAARMSTGKGFLGWGGELCLACDEACRLSKVDGLFNHFDHAKEAQDCSCKGTGKTIGDEKLLRFLWENKHATPFEMAGATVEVQAPIMVFREWHRHRTQSYNEMSGRYIELPEMFYVPSVERMTAGGQSAANKQGSGVTLDSAVVELARKSIRDQCASAFQTYRDMLALGVSKELARVVLPVNTYSRMRASANLRNWLGFLSLRSSAKNPAAQWEIRQFADAVHVELAKSFPRTVALFDGR